MKRPVLPILSRLAALLLCGCEQHSRPDRRTRELLTELDGYIKAREMYVVRKKDQMEVLTRLAGDLRDPERRYDLEMRIADEYFAFSFDSFVDYWLVFEVMCNHELGNPGSVYLHMDRGGKLIAGPCWDFDWGILSFHTSPGEYDLVNAKAFWYERLFRDPAFKEKVKARFQELLPRLQTIPAYMDECEALLTESARLNFQLWNPADDRSQNGGNIINGDENLSFHNAVKRLKDNYNTHLKVMARKL